MSGEHGGQGEDISADQASWECDIEKRANNESQVVRCAIFVKNDVGLPGSQQGVCIVLQHL